MINIYKSNTQTGTLDKIKEPVKGCWINIVKPTKSEIEEISKKVNISENVLRYPLDISEKAHIDEIDESLLIIVDSPFTEYKDGEKIYTTIPVGMILVRNDIFITISQGKIDAINAIINNKKENYVQTDKKSRLVFRILYDVAQDYIRYLTYISKDLESFERQMLKTIKNKEVFKLLKFEKCMVYFNTSIKGNQVVLEKLNRGKSIKLYEEDEEILEDTMIENRQAIEMIQTYSDILNGIIDLFSTMVSNNLNTVMKVLTSLTVLISLPTLISSFLGMNVDFPFNTGKVGFYMVVLVSVIVTIVTYLILKRKDMI